MAVVRTVDGRQTLGEIETAIANLQRQERTLQGELEAGNAERIALMGQRTAAYRELATVRTRHALADGVIDRADRLSVRVEALLQARQRSIDSLRTRQAVAIQRRDEFVARAAQTSAEIERLETELDVAGEAARTALAEEPAHRARLARLEEAASIHTRAAEKTERATADRHRKGADYEADPLFMYLWNRKYRSAGYAPGALIRWADDQVAALVGYTAARANYAILVEIPKRLAGHTARLAQTRDAAQREVDAAVAERIRTLAGTDLVAALPAARDRQRADTDALEKTEAEIAEIAGQLNRYAEGLDDGFRQAVDLSAEVLAQESTARLTALARETAEPTDDEIANRIANLDSRIETLVRANEAKRRELDTIAKRRQDLVQVAADFRRAHYDEPGSQFSAESVIGAVLQEVIRGALSRDGYWDQIRRNQRWRGRSADPFRRQEGFPPFGGGWMGGSWSSGSSGGKSRGGGGGSSGPDFSTGGGF